MGLRVEIVRGKYRSPRCYFDGVSEVTVVNVPGPSEPTEDAPAAVLSTNAYGQAVVRPDMPDAGWLAMGGSYAATTDSRWREAHGVYGAIPVHDYDMSE